MKNEHKLMVPFKSAVRIAVVFFSAGSLLFVLQLLSGYFIPLSIFGVFFIVIAVIFNSISLVLILTDLIKRDRLESFYAFCIILANLPIAMGYAYILTEFTF